MQASLVVLSALFLAACGGAAAPTAGGSAATPAAQGSPPGPCVARMAKIRPEAPTDEVGAITIRKTADGCTFEARSSTGGSADVPACSPKSKDSIYLAVCALGGDMAWPASPDATGGATVIELKVGRYTKPDPQADLRLICAPFETLKNPSDGKPFASALVSSMDASQRSRVRQELLADTMTSRQWRVWLRTLRENPEAANATLRDAATAAKLTCAAEWLQAK